MTDDQALIYLDDQEAGLVDLAGFLEALHNKWQPHEGQKQLGWALIHGGFKDIFACCGRNWGKTEEISYLEWRYAYEHPKSENYVFGPLSKQIREILWASGRIQGLGPEEYRKSINTTEMRVTLTNGSFIKLDGSDNVDAYRGIKPKGLSVYDELKDMRPDFIDAYDPNRAAFDSPAIYIGTPPEFHNHFVDYMERAKANHMKTWFYLHAPSSQNPFLSRRFLENKEKELTEAGERDKWLREYEAIFVMGGKRSIFPQFLKLTFSEFKPPIDLNKWHLMIIFDPAASSVFGVLFILFNPYSKRMIIFDEIYEDNANEMTARKMFERTQEKIKPYRGKVRDIRWVYDEAARYFMQEINEIASSDWSMEPSRKAQVGIDGYVSIVRTVLNKSLVEVSSNCVKFIWEMSGYMKLESGKIPKVNDHLINCFQYGLQALGFNVDDEIEQKPDDPFLSKRYIRMEDELPSNDNLVDFDNYGSSSSLEELEF